MHQVIHIPPDAPSNHGGRAVQWLWGVLPGCALSGGDGGEPQHAPWAVRGPGVVRDTAGRYHCGLMLSAGAGQAEVASVPWWPRPVRALALLWGAPGDLGGQWL